MSEFVLSAAQRSELAEFLLTKERRPWPDSVEDAIRVEFACPPIPIRTCDWAAWLDGHEERGSGVGPTAQAAVDDLLESLSLTDASNFRALKATSYLE